jgi:hypothetical protein
LSYKSFYEAFGVYKEEVVNSSLTYRGWAPFGALTSEPKWMIQRESVVAGVTTIEYVDDADINNVWDDRASLFGDIPFSNDYSLFFDGVNDYVNLGTNAVFEKERTDSFSLSFWFKPRAFASTYIYSKRATSVAAGISINMVGGGGLVFEIANSSTLKVAGRVTGFIAGTWYFCTMTYAGTSLLSGLKVYINGVLQTLSNTTDTLATNSIATASSAYIGQINTSAYYDGHLDEISYWDDYVLSQSEVTEMWNDGDPIDLSTMATYANCTCWYRCGDNIDDANPTLKDVKGTADGTMTNMLSSNFVTVTP